LTLSYRRLDRGRPPVAIAFIGKNGIGKSSLSKAVAGHPAYKMQWGDIVLDGESIME
jgi:Fe-S cluster assembly ATP-binding protein